MDIIDGSGLWSVTDNSVTPPPPPIPAGGGAGGRGRLIYTMEDRSYYEALKWWLSLGRSAPMNEAERMLLARARKRQQDEDEMLLL
jgi:hypothetical protein